MIEFAHALGLEILLEAHTDSEFERALSTDADLIGINNRDLRTLTVDLMTTRNILEKVPADERAVVSESGVETPDEALFLKRCGADALLVGSALMRAEDICVRSDRVVSAHEPSARQGVWYNEQGGPRSSRRCGRGRARLRRGRA